MEKRIYVGTCGFNISLARYVRLFDALEVNSTFYRFPTERSLKNWQKIFSQAQGFFLSLKAYQGLTHPISSPTWRRSSLTREELQALSERVGCLKLTPETEEFVSRSMKLIARLKADFWLFQLPKSCKERAGGIKAFFESLKDKFETTPLLGLEIRWSDPDLLEELNRTLSVLPVFDPFINADLTERFFPRLSTLYLRLHGGYERGRINYDKSYSDQELLWLRGMLQDSAAERIFVLFNNLRMYEDAQRFKDLITL
ncbi:DUF72 domain-containing protein [Thermosulfuriphilus ammonigenes]|uniref:DUF72 domain-containing protein n=1 Tax=Thermosulfuriphilus ammonigenes TaxID=1936021 RepID=A0A6G7PYI1_9BACT|nr:DUF72 domain-containing protein [Thermosulfuriphilus ammonigenes]MBA2849071.1 uncharacterized protein YecE (DUF72 family) [Thermosulfuriphilus ammonigenes]QIJ72755.1 DUF72 domain-containing protein [Thermosulfuriphilus ammonigenes]